MALVVADCRRWRSHHQYQHPFIPRHFNAGSRSHLLLIPKRVVWCFGKTERPGALGIFSSSGVRSVSSLQLHRSSFSSIRPKLKLRGSVASRFSKSAVIDGEQIEEETRPPFDLDLAVLLAGFAFESYNTPTEDMGVSEMDGADCETIYLSREFIESIYDGQLFVKLKKGTQFPGLDVWGTSDPYVVLRIGDCSVRSKTIWANKDPVWNEDFTLNIKTSAEQKLQVAAWDANIITSPRRMGNTTVSMEGLCDGELHSFELSLQGMGGGGKVFLEVHFKTSAQIEAEKSRFSIASVFSGELLQNSYKSVFGEDGISVGDFMGDFTSLLNNGINLSKPSNAALETSENGANGGVSATELAKGPSPKDAVVEAGPSDQSKDGDLVKEAGNEEEDADVELWEDIIETFSETLKPLGIDGSVLKDGAPWEITEDVKSLGLEFQKRAEALYAESGLAVIEEDTPKSLESSTTENNGGESERDSGGKDALEGLMKQTEGIVGMWAIFNKSQQQNGRQEEPRKESGPTIEVAKADSTNEENVDVELDERNTKMFTTAESAMEAWALLATTMGGSCFVKSDFEKICFVENKETDTQVAIWRDFKRQRLVVAFRGTEQTKWKDVVTDLSLLASGFNPERVAGGNNLKDEPLVHSGFLKAYDSVKYRLLSLVRESIQNGFDPLHDRQWHVYVTGHSLGGALATLFALELSTSKLAKNDQIRVTMYNYGSPRVGNKLFADKYNKFVMDSWRVVNHRDIVPTVPRLMGYCHVAQPIYLTAEKSLVSDLLDDGYHGDVIGEATPDAIIDKFMNGEQTMLQKLLDTEISMLRAMRDGSAVMQHMEDFYYITLLQRVESRIR